MASKPLILKPEIKAKFQDTWPKVVSILCQGEDNKDISQSKEWLEQVLEYNVPHGKQFRGLLTVVSSIYFSGNISMENIELACIMGWVIEILQASCLVADDIMDNSETRRGEKCWYKLDNVKLAAVNDVIMLENAAYALIRKHFREKKYYADLMSMVQDVVYKTTLGQTLDSQSSSECDFKTFTKDKYETICKYKTSYYTFYLPVVSSMIISERKELFREMVAIEKLLLNIGYFFQIQDDYLDAFGDSDLTGKIGTDIIDGKCTWLIVHALSKATPTDKLLLADLYKKGEKEAEKVKLLYEVLGVKEDFKMLETKLCKEIQSDIESLNNFPVEPLKQILEMLFKRNK